MKVGLPYVVLMLRIGVVWWVLLVAITAIFSMSVAFLAALLVFPWIAFGIGTAAAVVQYRSLVAASWGAKTTANPLVSGQRQSLSLDLPATQAMRIAVAAVTSVFGAVEQRVTSNEMTAHILERGVKPTGLRTLRSDELTIIAADDGGAHPSTRSTLQISCEPMHAWLYALFWVEAGRGARQVEALRAAIWTRVRAQHDVADALDQQGALRARAEQAELQLLRAQIEPHFLFNTLAHLRASITASPLVAQSMLDALIEFLRANSQTAASTTISLADELKKVEAYLKIMQIRLGERLRYVISSDASLHKLLVPNASVLILVENAIKHGIERINGSGLISVTCSQDGAALVIEVDNDGPVLAMLPDRGMGSMGGLSNLRERLLLIYGGVAQMQIEDRHAGGDTSSATGSDASGVRATLRLPTQ